MKNVKLVISNKGNLVPGTWYFLTKPIVWILVLIIILPSCASAPQKDLTLEQKKEVYYEHRNNRLYAEIVGTGLGAVVGTAVTVPWPEALGAAGTGLGVTAWMRADWEKDKDVYKWCLVGGTILGAAAAVLIAATASNEKPGLTIFSDREGAIMASPFIILMGSGAGSLIGLILENFEPID